MARRRVSPTTWPWWCRPGSAAASCSTAGCSTAPAATPATSATSPSNPTADRVGAAATAVSRPRRRGRRSPPITGRPGRPADPATIERTATLVGRAVADRGHAARPAARGRGRLGGARVRRPVLRGRPGRDRPPRPARLRPRRASSDPPGSDPRDRSWGRRRSAGGDRRARRRRLSARGPCGRGERPARRRGTLASWTRPTRPKPRRTARRSRRSSPSSCPTGWQGVGALREGRRRAVRAGLAGHAARPRPAGRVVAAPVRRRRPERARAGDPGRGVLPGRRAHRHRQRRVRHPDGRQHHPAVGDRGAEAALPAPHPLRRGPVVPGLLRAQRRVRSRQPGLPRRARRRRVGHQRPEDLDVGRPSGQLDLRAGPHRPRRAEAQGHLVPAGPDGPAGRRGPARSG